MIERIIDSSLVIDLKPEFIPVSEIRLCVLNSDQKISVAFDTKLLKYFEDMLMLLVDIYWISEAVLVKLESARCQLIVVIEAKYAKESILSLPSTVARIELCALSSIVTIVVLAVIIAVLVTVTEIDLAVSEMCVNLAYAERFRILDIHFCAVSRWFFIWEIRKFNSIIYYHIQKADIEAIQISSLTDRF